jgi:GNAT superfamily N-acetyltransferase
VRIAVVAEGDLEELLALLRAYCDFYSVAPSDDGLRAMCRALIADPAREGMQLLARDGEDDRAVGFATIFWSWATTRAGRIGIMNDLFVAPTARGSGVGAALIEACRQRCAERGAIALEWQTALDNETAQRVYDRIGGQRSQWLSYELPVPLND